MVTHIIHFKFRQEALEEARAFIKRSIDSHKGEEGLLRYESYYDTSDETKFCHMKQFASKEAAEAHNNQPELQAFVSQLKQYLEMPPQFSENSQLHSL